MSYGDEEPFDIWNAIRNGQELREEATNSDKLQEIWETLIREQPSRHRMSGWSVKDGELIAVLGRDGMWHDIRHDLNSPASAEPDQD